MSEKVDHDFTEESKVLGYYPFTRISPLEWLTFKELYGDEWILGLFSRLKDPWRLHPDWAKSFAGTASKIDPDMLSEAEDVYALVTSTKGYRNRKVHTNAFNRCFFNVIWPRFKAGAADMEEPVRGLCLADFERWRVILKARAEADRVEQQKREEKKARRLAHEAAEKAAQERKAAEAAKAAEEAKVAAERKAASEAAAIEKQKRQTLPRGPSPARKEPVIERKPAGSPAKPSSGGAWRNPNPGQPIVVRKKTME